MPEKPRRRVLLAAIVLLLIAPPDALSAPAGLLRTAEEEVAAGNDRAAIAAYVQALENLRRLPPGELEEWVPEVELALRRLSALAAAEAAADAVLEAFISWSEAMEHLEPAVAALARYFAAGAVVQTQGDIERAREILLPLGILEGWWVIGPFDNERGGGFLTAYGPEKGIDLQARHDGKKHEVAWRKLPRRPLFGAVDLDELLEPNDEALAYLVTFVRSDRRRAAALCFGSDEGYRVWVNGVLAGSEDLHRPRRFDQSALAIELEEGWNSILFKVAEAEGPWELEARLTTLDGSALEGVVEGEPDAASLERFRDLAAAEGAARKEAPRLGSRSRLERRIVAEPDDARAHYLLGTLLLELEAHDVSEHPDTALLSRAIEIDARPAIHHLELARSLERSAGIEANRDDNAWRAALERAAAQGSAFADYRLARYYFETFGNTRRARRLLEKALARNPHLAAAHLLRGEIEERLGFPLALERAVAAASRAAPESPEVILARAELCEREGRQQERRLLLEGLLARNRLDGRPAWALAALLEAMGEAEAARGILDEQARLFPFDTAVDEHLAERALGRDDPAGAVEHLRAALEIRPHDHRLAERLGSALLELGERDAALLAWDRALELQPNSPELRERLEYLRASRSRFDEEVRREARAIIAASLDDPQSPEDDEPARILLEFTAVEVNRDGTSREFVQTIARILNDRGVRDYDTFETYYAAGEQVVEFKKARVIRRDGKEEEARLSRHGGTGGEAGTWRLARIDLPPLSAGDVVEVQYLREDLAQSFFGDYFGRRELFQGALPIREKVFVLRAPAGRRFHFYQRNLDLAPREAHDEESGRVTWTWSMRDIPRIDPEPGMPPAQEFAPLLEISTFGSWNEFSRWYWNLIKRQFESSPEIARKVRELTSGKETELERLRALYDFVVTDIRYNAWEFGVHGFKPYNAAAVFTRRFGDCKDKATLLCVLAREAGITGHPVLIYANPLRHEEDLTLPMVNHFNHCIAYFPASESRPALFLDGTAQHHGLDELPSMDRGARVLVVREDSGLIEQIPWNVPEEVAVEEEWTAALAADHSAELKVRLVARGDYAVSLRQAFEVAGQRQAALERIFGRRFSGSSIVSESFSGLESLVEPVTMAVTVRVPRFAVASPEGLAVAMPEDFFDMGRSLGALGALEARRHDVLLGAPRRSRLRAVLLLPAGVGAKAAPEERAVESRFGRFQFSFSEGAGRLELERLIEITSPRVPAADYPAFRELAAGLERLRAERIILERKGGTK
jgi:tetratricopeptide (TPR) repeat protein